MKIRLINFERSYYGEFRVFVFLNSISCFIFLLTDLRQEVSIQKRDDLNIPDNDKAVKQLVTKQKMNQFQQQQQTVSQTSSIIDSNKLKVDSQTNDTCSKASTKCKRKHLKHFYFFR